MHTYEVWGIGYTEDGYLTGYMKTYGKFEQPAEAMLFAHDIDSEWLKEHGELTEKEAAIDINVELVNTDESVEKTVPLWHGEINVYHRMNFGLQPNENVV